MLLLFLFLSLLLVVDYETFPYYCFSHECTDLSPKVEKLANSSRCVPIKMR